MVDISLHSDPKKIGSDSLKGFQNAGVPPDGAGMTLLQYGISKCKIGGDG